MKHLHQNRAVLIAALALCAAGSQAQLRGPSSSQDPYILPAAGRVETISIITVGDFVNLKPDGSPYYLVGIPDGMGAWSGGKGAFNLLVNHELRGIQGTARRHGEIGAFVSQWNIDSKTLRVVGGHDLIHTVNIVNGDGVLRRLCSADLAAQGAFYYPEGQVGTEIKLFLNGEEDDDGRAFAHIVDGSLGGTSYELPLFGKQAWENVVACPTPQDKTLVIAIDDTTPGQVFAYIGTKQADGLPHEKAGLTNGSQWGIRVPNVVEESRETGLNGETRFELAELGDVSGLSEDELNALCDTAGVTRFLRPEDGSWDPTSPNDFYFVTTDRFDNNEQEGRSRLYRLRFDDISNPGSGRRDRGASRRHRRATDDGQHDDRQIWQCPHPRGSG
ncbi:MAG: hypothetical protein ACR2HJ_06685 [Fimbriimonadales bacterium]